MYVHAVHAFFVKRQAWSFARQWAPGFASTQAWSRDDLHADAVVCTEQFRWRSSSSEDEVVQAYILPDGPSVTLREFLFDSIPHRSPPGTESLDEEIEPMRSVTGDTLVWYLAATCSTRIALRVEGDTASSPPYFVTHHELTIPRLVSLSGRVSADLADNPDVRAFHLWDQSLPVLDRYDAMLKHRAPGRGTPYPRGCWLPGELETSQGHSVCVYRLPNEDRERVEVYLLDSTLNLDHGAHLIRRAATHTGELLKAEIASFPPGCVMDRS